MRSRLASDPSILLIPPDLNLDICAMREVGTISWFLEPISTWKRMFIGSSLQLKKYSSYRCKYSKLLWSYITEVCSVEFHGSSLRQVVIADETTWSLLCLPST